MKQSRHVITALALLVVPNGAAGEQAKAQVAHAVKQLVLHLLVAEFVQIPQDQDAHHDRSGGRWAPAPLGIRSGEQPGNDLGEVGKVDSPGNDLQWISQGLDLLLASSVGKEVELQGAARWRFGLAHAVIVASAGLGQGEVFRGSP